MNVTTLTKGLNPKLSALKPRTHSNHHIGYLCKQVLFISHQYPMPSSIYAGGANGSWVSSVSFSNNGMKIATVCEDNRYSGLYFVLL